MLHISQLKLKPGHTEEALQQAICACLPSHGKELLSYDIVKQSIDARKKPDVMLVYSVDVQVENERQTWNRIRHQKKGSAKHITRRSTTSYVYPTISAGHLLQGDTAPGGPVIVGSGPAGLFCAYVLAKAGVKPVLIERGAPVEERIGDVERFWREGVLKPDSNVQFGEGGAGTFSDGKLNTGVKDPLGRNREILRVFVDHGAPSEILYEQKPHIGTDCLIKVIKAIREDIVSAGGVIRFHTRFLSYHTISEREGMMETLRYITVATPQGVEQIPAEQLVLAIGHSARDTFYQLYESGLPMEAKAFAVGVRVEHLQTEINRAQYGVAVPKQLSPAPYKMAVHLEGGRSAYTFCMCPGGYVVNASSEKEALAVNGMSYRARNSRNANSAVVVPVTPEDDFNFIASESIPKPLRGIAFQRDLERRAYAAGKGAIPIQRYEDFCRQIPTRTLGTIEPCCKGDFALTDLTPLFPDTVRQAIQDGIRSMGTKIRGFDAPDVLLSGVESRTSSPVRLLRQDNLQTTASIEGIYPCGEGAGYAGGIMSAAIDGMKVAEKIVEVYENKPFTDASFTKI